MFGNSRYRPHKLGQQAEIHAEDFLLTKGLQLIARNFRCRRGEIDRIMRDRDSLVFIEVRYRTRQDYGSALESVDYRKQQRIIHCAEYFLMKHPAEQGHRMRFDVVCVGLNRQPAECHWIQHAFEAF